MKNDSYFDSRTVSIGALIVIMFKIVHFSSYVNVVNVTFVMGALN